MEARFKFSAPAGSDDLEIETELKKIVGGVGSVSVYPTQPLSDKLGQIDGAWFEILIEVLDTKAVAAIVEGTIAAVAGYIVGQSSKGERKSDG